MADDQGALFDRIEARLDEVEAVIRSEVVTPFIAALDRLQERLDSIEMRLADILDELGRD